MRNSNYATCKTANQCTSNIIETETIAGVTSDIRCLNYVDVNKKKRPRCVDHEVTVGVLQRRVRRQDRVVRLYDGCRHLRRRVDSKLQLRFLALVDAYSFHQQRREATSGSAAERVEDEESLQTVAVVTELSYFVQNQIDDFLADGIMASCIVVGRVLFAGDHLFWMEQCAVRPRTNLV